MQEQDGPLLRGHLEAYDAHNDSKKKDPPLANKRNGQRNSSQGNNSNLSAKRLAMPLRKLTSSREVLPPLLSVSIPQAKRCWDRVVAVRTNSASRFVWGPAHYGIPYPCFSAPPFFTLARHLLLAKNEDIAESEGGAYFPPGKKDKDSLGPFCALSYRFLMVYFKEKVWSSPFSFFFLRHRLRRPSSTEAPLNKAPLLSRCWWFPPHFFPLLPLLLLRGDPLLLLLLLRGGPGGGGGGGGGGARTDGVSLGRTPDPTTYQDRDDTQPPPPPSSSSFSSSSFHVHLAYLHTTDGGGADRRSTT